jgi:hypothetical protein
MMPISVSLTIHELWFILQDCCSKYGYGRLILLIPTEARFERRLDGRDKVPMTSGCSSSLHRSLGGY